MTIGTIVLIVLVILLLGAFPIWPYSKRWGYYPSGGLGVAALILLVMVLAFTILQLRMFRADWEFYND